MDEEPFSKKYPLPTRPISTHLPGNGRVINVGRVRELAERRELEEHSLTLTRRSRTNDKAPSGDGNGSEKGRPALADAPLPPRWRLTRRIEGGGHVARRTNERGR